MHNLGLQHQELQEQPIGPEYSHIYIQHSRIRKDNGHWTDQMNLNWLCIYLFYYVRQNIFTNNTK